jgi:4-carboxymuconolactone decarboxylase
MARLEAITKREQVPAEHQPVFDEVVKSRGSVHGPFTMLLHCPPLAKHFVDIGGYIRFGGQLDHRVRVLAALTVAREFEAMYIWGAQTGQARKRNVPESTIAAIRDGQSQTLPPEDAQIVDFTRELIRRHRVGEATMNALLERFGKAQVVELTATVGYYSMLAMTANAVELEPGPGADVLKV